MDTSGFHVKLRTRARRRRGEWGSRLALVGPTLSTIMGRGASFGEANGIVMGPAMADEQDLQYLETMFFTHSGAVPAEGEDDSVIGQDMDEGVLDAGVEGGVLGFLHSAFDTGLGVAFADLAGGIRGIEDGEIAFDAVLGEHLQENLGIHVMFGRSFGVEVIGIGCAAGVAREGVARDLGLSQISLDKILYGRNSECIGGGHGPCA